MTKLHSYLFPTLTQRYEHIDDVQRSSGDLSVNENPVSLEEDEVIDEDETDHEPESTSRPTCEHYSPKERISYSTPRFSEHLE